MVGAPDGHHAFCFALAVGEEQIREGGKCKGNMLPGSDSVERKMFEILLTSRPFVSLAFSLISGMPIRPMRWCSSSYVMKDITLGTLSE